MAVQAIQTIQIQKLCRVFWFSGKFRVPCLLLYFSIVQSHKCIYPDVSTVPQPSGHIFCSKGNMEKWASQVKKKKKSGIIIWSLVFRIYRLRWMKEKRGFSAGSGLCVMSLSAFSLRSSKDAYFWSFSGMHPGKCNRTSKQNRLILNLLLFVTTICPLVGRISPRPYSHQKHFLRSFFTRPLVLGR